MTLSFLEAERLLEHLLWPFGTEVVPQNELPRLKNIGARDRYRDLPCAEYGEESRKSR